MSVESIVRAVRLFKRGKLTMSEAKKLADSIPPEELQDGMHIDESAAAALKRAFPGIPWRVTLDRTGHRTRTFVTTLKDDPREHFRRGPWCPRCGKDHRTKKQREAGLGMGGDD